MFTAFATPKNCCHLTAATKKRLMICFTPGRRISPLCLFVVNVQEFGEQLSTAIERLQADRLVVEMGAGHGFDNPCFVTTTISYNNPPNRQGHDHLPSCHLPFRCVREARRSCTYVRENDRCVQLLAPPIGKRNLLR